MTENPIIEVPPDAPESFEELFEYIPSERISQTAIEFAHKILELNQSRLLKLQDNQP